jgi:hypothetical protein
MQFEDGPQLPLTNRRKALVAAGLAMWAAQCAAAFALAPRTTGPGDADAGVLGALFAGCIAWSVVAVLLLVRQTDLPDVATASMLVVISAFGIFALSAALDVRGTPDEVNITDALFLGITAGGLTSLMVWGIAMGIARVLRLPTTAHLREE